MHSRLHSRRPPLFDRSPYILISLLTSLPVLRHRKGTPATATPSECALTSLSQVAENTTTLSPVECAVTQNDALSPLECAVPKKWGEGGNCRVSPQFPTLSSFARHSSAFANALPLLCFHSLTNCPICKSFVFMFLQTAGGGVPHPL